MRVALLIARAPGATFKCLQTMSKSGSPDQVVAFDETAALEAAGWMKSGPRFWPASWEFDDLDAVEHPILTPGLAIILN